MGFCEEMLEHVKAALETMPRDEQVNLEVKARSQNKTVEEYLYFLCKQNPEIRIKNLCH